MKKYLAIIVALILMLTLAGCGKDETTSAEKEARAADSYNTVEEGGLSFQMPDYFGDPQMSGDVKNYYAEKGSGLTDLQLYSIDGVLDEDSFESDCKESYESYVSGLKNSDEVEDFQEVNSGDKTINCGLHCMVYTYSFTMSGVKCDSMLTFINNTKSNKVVLVSLVQSEQSEYDYTDAYVGMVDTCEITDIETESTETESAESSNTDDDSSESDSGLISPEFKKTMDDYEAWFDHYCDVMKRYKEDSSNLELLSEMTDLLTEETKMLEELENMDQSEMNTAELAYYIDVTARIEKKLLEVAY